MSKLKDRHFPSNLTRKKQLSPPRPGLPDDLPDAPAPSCALQMKNTGTLFELIQRLDDFEDGDPSRPLVIYAQNGAGAGRDSPARVCPRVENAHSKCPLDPSLSEVLSVEQAREAIRVWSAWRGGVTPSPGDRFNSVMFFSIHGAYFPLETDREGM